MSLHLEYTGLMTQPVTWEGGMTHHKFLSQPSFPAGVTSVIGFSLWSTATEDRDTFDDAGINMTDAQFCN